MHTWMFFNHALIRFRIRKGKPSMIVANEWLPVFQPLLRAARWKAGFDGVRVHRFAPPSLRARERWVRNEAKRLGVNPTELELHRVVNVHPWSYPAARGELLKLAIRSRS